MSIHIPRLPWDEHFMLQAHLVATRATCDRGPELLLDPGRHGVGALIVQHRRVIASGYNGSPPGSVHCDSIPTCPCCKREYPNGVDGTICPTCFDGTKDIHAEGSACRECGGEAKIVGGHKMVEGHCVRTIHSEMNALMQCALDKVSPEHGRLYCTASPCYDCAKAIIRAGIQSVVFGEAYDSRYGLSPTVQELLESCDVHVHRLPLKIVDGRIRRAV
jgi:dCMP deaminase